MVVSDKEGFKVKEHSGRSIKQVNMRSAQGTFLIFRDVPCYLIIYNLY